MKISNTARQRVRLYFQDRKEGRMKRVCNNCGVELKPMDTVEIHIKHRRQTIRVCSHECRNEWWLGYAGEIQEQLEGLEVQDGR